MAFLCGIFHILGFSLLPKLPTHITLYSNFRFPNFRIPNFRFPNLHLDIFFIFWFSWIFSSILPFPRDFPTVAENLHDIHPHQTARPLVRAKKKCEISAMVINRFRPRPRCHYSHLRVPHHPFRRQGHRRQDFHLVVS